MSLPSACTSTSRLSCPLSPQRNTSLVDLPVSLALPLTSNLTVLLPWCLSIPNQLHPSSFPLPLPPVVPAVVAIQSLRNVLLVAASRPQLLPPLESLVYLPKSNSTKTVDLTERFKLPSNYSEPRTIRLEDKVGPSLTTRAVTRSSWRREVKAKSLSSRVKLILEAELRLNKFSVLSCIRVLGSFVSRSFGFLWFVEYHELTRVDYYRGSSPRRNQSSWTSQRLRSRYLYGISKGNLPFSQVSRLQT